MLVYLVRHGIAIDRDDPDCPPEPERYLTPKGIEKTRKAAEGFSEMGAKPGVALSSPYLRAMQTGEIFCEAIGISSSKIKKTDALKSEASPKLIIEELSKLKEEEEVICFGHAPHMDEVIAHVTHASKSLTELKKAGVACLEIHSFSPVDGTLLWLVTPHILRDLA